MLLLPSLPLLQRLFLPVSLPFASPLLHLELAVLLLLDQFVNTSQPFVQLCFVSRSEVVVKPKHRLISNSILHLPDIACSQLEDSFGKEAVCFDWKKLGFELGIEGGVEIDGETSLSFPLQQLVLLLFVFYPLLPVFDLLDDPLVITQLFISFPEGLSVLGHYWDRLAK